MAKPIIRKLTILNEAQPFGVCGCGHQFRGTRAEIQEQFDAHDCEEDASQAAVRIVREATEGE